MSLLVDSLERIRKFWEINDPTVASLLQPGLSIEEIEAQVQELPFRLPKEVYELYQWRNGVAQSCSFINHYGFLSLDEALDEYKELEEAKKEFREIVFSEEYTHALEERELFAKPWFPILGSDDLDYFLVLGDLEQQEVSPVLRCHLGGGTLPEKLVYETLTLFILIQAECFETGAYYINGTGSVE